MTALNWLLKESWERGGINWWVAPIFRQGKIPWRRMLRALPENTIKDSSKSELRIELLSGGVIQFLSADNPENLRGEGINALVMDEAARIQREAWEDSLRPALSDTAGKALFISTPKARNWFFEMWARGQDRKAWPEYESWTFPTADNPKVPKEDINQAKRTLPSDVFQQEYMAEFLEGTAGVFRKIDQCIAGALIEVPVRGRIYFMGVDLAKHQDFTVISIVDDAGQLVYWDRFNQIDWGVQKDRIYRLATVFNCLVLVDSTGVGDPIFDDLINMHLRVQGYRFSSESKRKLIESLIVAMDNRAVTFPDIPVLINELRIFEYQMGSQGTIRYSAPAGYHDDAVISLALANWCRTGTSQAWEMPYETEWGQTVEPWRNIPQGGIGIPPGDRRDISGFAHYRKEKSPWD